MTDTIYKPESKEQGAAPPARTTADRSGHVGPLGFGSGPVLAAGIMVGGAVLFAGWGLTQILTADESSGQGREMAAVAADDPRGDEGTVTVTLPDKDGNGIADELEPPKKESLPAVPPAREPDPKLKTLVYTIQPGDTLTKISGETGVPIGHLVEANKIQNPNLIYAGASLLIPPAG